MIQRFLTGMPNRFETAKGDPRFAAVVGRRRRADGARARHRPDAADRGRPQAPLSPSPAILSACRPAQTRKSQPTAGIGLRRPADRALRRRSRAPGRGLESPPRARTARTAPRPRGRPAARRRCSARRASAPPSRCSRRVLRSGKPHEEIVETSGRLYHVRRLPVGRGKETTHVLSWFEDITERRAARDAAHRARPAGLPRPARLGRGARDLEPARRHRRLRRGARLARGQERPRASGARRASSAT